ncbi:MAG: uracil-DNA glycosylase [Gammaproteobacteria bacterium]|nr:uracil-DNA glycosylase [Gammaproteobacteria bacterium]MBU1480998.1 uracil-DNA glycosylase [Gammaproteobacteria bacterium]
MNIRDDNVLRELNLFPLWVRRGTPVADAPEASAPVAETQAACRLGGGEADTQQPAMGIVEPVLSPVEGLNPSRVDTLNWEELKQTVHDCTACKLRAGCTQTVFGVGDENADWLFVGEGPGADEDAQGEPFVGQAGKLLDNMLAAIKLKRGNNVYIANIVKCRPPSNRNPEPDEIATCMPYLQQQIALIKPKLIVALGKVAATSLLGREATLGSLRGTVHDLKGTPLIVTYHPAYLLRSPAEKAKAWQDLCFAVQRMTE